jgi:hypothetical protein
VWGLLAELHQFSPEMVDELCELERTGELTSEHVRDATLFLKQYVQKQAPQAGSAANS